MAAANCSAQFADNWSEMRSHGATCCLLGVELQQKRQESRRFFFFFSFSGYFCINKTCVEDVKHTGTSKHILLFSSHFFCENTNLIKNKNLDCKIY